MENPSPRADTASIPTFSEEPAHKVTLLAEDFLSASDQDDMSCSVSENDRGIFSSEESSSRDEDFLNNILLVGRLPVRAHTAL